VPPLSTDVVRAAMEAPAPTPPIFTESLRDPRQPRKAPAPLVEYVGQTIYSQFVVEELCGVGSTGTVFRARQLGIGRPVALKVLHPDLKSQPEIVARFQREAQIASRISHPNIVHLYLAGLLPDGNLFLAMEFVTGTPLSAAVPPQGMPLERAVHIIGQVLAALGEAHRVGIVHRDLKPENVMLTRVGEDADFVKVLDFGIARVLDHKTVATRSGLVFGSPKYISPEAAAGDPADARSDIYSCGVLLYEMLAGRAPFDAEKPLDLLMKHIREEPPRLSSLRKGPPLPGAVELAVHQAIEKSPERRFRTAEVFAQALRNAAGMGERRLAASSPKLPPASFVLPEKPVVPEKAPATPGAAAHPIASPAHAMMMARPVLPAPAAPPPAVPAAPPPAAPQAPPIVPAMTPGAPFAIAPPAIAAAPPPAAPQAPPIVPAMTPGAPFAIAPPTDASAPVPAVPPFALEEDSISPPAGRGKLWLALVLSAVAVGLAVTLIAVLASGDDTPSGKQPDAAIPAEAGAAAPAPDVASAADTGSSPPDAGSPPPDAGPPPPDAAPVDTAPATTDVPAAADQSAGDAGSEAPGDGPAAEAPDAGPGAPETSPDGAVDAPAAVDAVAAVAPPEEPRDARTTARRDARRRDAGSVARADTAGADSNLRPFPGPTPLVTVTSPKDIGR
jgi:serine/threonine-protein kinase